MKTFSKTKLAAAVSASAIALLALHADAASDGTLGATSDGDVTISMSVSDLVRITGLDDITLTDLNTDGVFDGSDDFCVGSNKASMDYNVTLDVASETSFVLTGASDNVSFTPTFDDGTTSENTFAENTPHATTFNTTSTDTDGTCNTPNTTLSILTEDADGKISTSFSGSINILIDPV